MTNQTSTLRPSILRRKWTLTINSIYTKWLTVMILAFP